MTSAKQIEANRNNAQKSCGPKTQLGKETVRNNAVKHGLCAKTIALLSKEDAEEFAQHVDAWIDEFRPRTPSETYFIRHAASLSWKLERADRFEFAALAERTDEATNACSGESEEQIARAKGLAGFDTSALGERVRRYQLSIHREVRKDLESFSKLRFQAERPGPREEAADAVDAVFDAPNKAISDEPSAAEKGEKPVERREPVPASAPNKAYLPGRVKLSSVFDKTRTIVNLPKREPLKPGGSGWLDVSVSKR